MKAEAEVALLVDRFMRRTHLGIHEKAKAFDKDRIGPAGGMLLLTVADMEPIAINELVVLLARDKSQMTRTVQSLEKKGFVKRKTSATDARVSLLAITPKGAKFVEGMRSILTETIGGILSNCTRAEREMLRQVLSKALDSDQS